MSKPTIKCEPPTEASGLWTNLSIWLTQIGISNKILNKIQNLQNAGSWGGKIFRRKIKTSAWEKLIILKAHPETPYTCGHGVLSVNISDSGGWKGRQALSVFLGICIKKSQLKSFGGISSKSFVTLNPQWDTISCPLQSKRQTSWKECRETGIYITGVSIIIYRCWKYKTV